MVTRKWSSRKEWIPLPFCTQTSLSASKDLTHFATKILFKNIPLNVPDEELINLSLCYGQPVGAVRREKLSSLKDRGKVGSNRTLDVILNPGAAFENYFWLEGPLPSDQGRRIIVTHQNQPQQCSHCFGFSVAKYGEETVRCPGNANGRAFEALGTERAISPFAKFSCVGNIEEIIEDGEEKENNLRTIYKSPIVEKDEIILELRKEKEKLKQEK